MKFSKFRTNYHFKVSSSARIVGRKNRGGDFKIGGLVCHHKHSKRKKLHSSQKQRNEAVRKKGYHFCKIHHQHFITIYFNQAAGVNLLR